jgi:hypothetical protein
MPKATALPIAGDERLLLIIEGKNRQRASLDQLVPAAKKQEISALTS